MKPAKSKTGAATADEHDANNLRNAREFLARPAAHGGLDGFPCRWARLVLERLALQSPVK